MNSMNRSENYSLHQWEDGKSSDNTTFFKEVI